MEFFLSSLVTLLVIIDTLGTAAVFGALRARYSAPQSLAAA